MSQLNPKSMSSGMALAAHTPLSDKDRDQLILKLCADSDEQKRMLTQIMASLRMTHTMSPRSIMSNPSSSVQSAKAQSPRVPILSDERKTDLCMKMVYGKKNAGCWISRNKDDKRMKHFASIKIWTIRMIG